MSTFLLMVLKGAQHWVTAYHGNANWISRNFEGKQNKEKKKNRNKNTILDLTFHCSSFRSLDRDLQHVYSSCRAHMWAPVLREKCGADKSMTFFFILVIYIFFCIHGKKWYDVTCRVYEPHYYDLFMVKLNKNPKNIRLIFFHFMTNTSMEPLCGRRATRENTRRWRRRGGGGKHVLSAGAHATPPTKIGRAGDLQTLEVGRRAQQALFCLGMDGL